MREQPPPSEWAALERRLAAGHLDVSPALRGRVLAAVARELAAPVSPTRRESFGTFAAAAAAAVILVLNLARMAAPLTDFVRRPERPPQSVTALASSIRQAVPDLSEAEARRMAMIMSAREQVVPLPTVDGTYGGVVSMAGTR